MQENPSRQYPPKKTPWVMKQVWHDLLFAHWAVEPAQLKHLVPDSLPLDTFEGNAWIGVVPFWMSARPRLLPALPWLSTFPELNVRTYVTKQDKPGVYFFSLDAARRIAVEGAKRLFSLPYFTARMYAAWKEGWFHYKSERIEEGAPRAQLSLRYRLTGQALPFQKSSLEDFLTSRYCLYTVHPNGQLYRQEIDHAPWSLQPAEAQIFINTMTEAAGVSVGSTPPLLHFVKQQEMVGWLQDKVE